MIQKKLFFIYVAKHEEWQLRQKEDWSYVWSMTRFFHWWTKRHFDITFTLDADILPVIPGKLFDRISLDYLIRDHDSRGKTIYHFYLAYFNPFWTDCNTEGYTTENFGMIFWKRPKENHTIHEREKFYADENCSKVSHVLCHEILRMKGKNRKEYFESIHHLWDRHKTKDLPFLYYNEKYNRVSNNENYKYVTIDVTTLNRL